MITVEQIVVRCVYQIFSEFHLVPDQLNSETPIYGDRDGISSLALVRLIVDIEAAMEEEMGLTISLANDQVLSMTRSPFRNFGSLLAFVQECCGQTEKI